MPSPAKSTICDRHTIFCGVCGPSPVSQAAPDLQEQLGCARSCPYRQTRILTPIWESSDASGTLDGATKAWDVSKQVLSNLSALGIEHLIAIGGDDTLGYAAKLNDLGVKIIGIPKRMDNDVRNTE